MIEKAVAIALLLGFIMIGINGMLYMGSTALFADYTDAAGNRMPLNLYYGLDSGGYGSQLETKANCIDIGTEPSFSSTVPSQTQGFTPITNECEEEPIGINYAAEFMKIGFGTSLVISRFSEMFPLMAPIVNAIVLFTMAIQGFAMAYLGGTAVRGLFGRIVG